MTVTRLLYLGLAFPPGVADVFPEAQPAGHLIETCLVNSIRPYADIKSVGISWLHVEEAPPGGTAPGLPHALNLLECKPELFHRLRSLARLKRAYLDWTSSGWVPDVIMVCNFSPVYNGFVRWLSARANRPRLLLYLADSVGLQSHLSLSKRVRYALKPLRWLDSDMVRYFDACVAVSKDTEGFFRARNYPWLWLPNGCDAARAVRTGGAPPASGPRFGYFGTMAPHGGIDRLIEVFRGWKSNAELHICGWGKKKEEIAAACAQDSRLRFLGVKTPDECVRFVRDCDVMVNPRPIVPGNENNFSSKVFEYSLGGRAILTSRLSGVDQVLGPEAFYFDARQFEPGLRQALEHVASLPREELHRRGKAIQDRMLAEFSWERQGRRLRDFISAILPQSK